MGFYGYLNHMWSYLSRFVYIYHTSSNTFSKQVACVDRNLLDSKAWKISLKLQLKANLVCIVFDYLFTYVFSSFIQH